MLQDKKNMQVQGLGGTFFFDMPHHFYGQMCVQRGNIGHVDPLMDQNSKILIFLGHL